MKTKKLIILLGNTNDQKAVLSHISKLRCEITVQLFNEHKDCEILPTGGYGRRFNSTISPHFKYLKSYLLDLKIPESKILLGIDSKGTFQDLLMARSLIKKKNDSKIIINEVFIVTSEYHKERVKFICNKIFNNFEYNVVTEKDYPNTKISNETYSMIQKEAKIEKKKKMAEINNWVDIPLDSDSFPQIIYDNASSEHKHYDTISIALITAIIIIGSTPLSFDNNLKVLLISSILNVVIFLMYLRAAKFAKRARRVMVFLELSYEKQGFSVDYDRNKLEPWRLFQVKTWDLKHLASLIFIISLIPLFLELYLTIISYFR
jgi:uncharacterized membrane protein